VATQPKPLDEEIEVEVVIPEDRDPALSETTRPSDLGFPAAQREIEVEPLQDQVQPSDPNGMVEIRMAETIEEFTYGNPHQSFLLEVGKRYKVPVYVANYLYHLGKLSIRA
jgi:hypothetical protein